MAMQAKPWMSSDSKGPSSFTPHTHTHHSIHVDVLVSGSTWLCRMQNLVVVLCQSEVWDNISLLYLSIGSFPNWISSSSILSLNDMVSCAVWNPPYCPQDHLTVFSFVVPPRPEHKIQTHSITYSDWYHPLSHQGVQTSHAFYINPLFHTLCTTWATLVEEDNKKSIMALLAF